jgi:SAM-dependent MidA family methyltransferase
MRAARLVPGFHGATEVHLIEVSPPLQRRQRQTLGGSEFPVHWHEAIDGVPEGPLIVLANEFFDALPVHQAVKMHDGWHERVIEIDPSGNLAYATVPEPLPQFELILPPQVRAAPAGALFEWRTDHVAHELARRVVREGGAALIIDYGHMRSGTGDTLQAVGDHAFANPLEAAGMVDVTAHVDFQALADAAESIGARVLGPIEQGEFLRRLGIEARANALKQAARPDRAKDVETALGRLVSGAQGGMGKLFKVIAITDTTLGPLPGFEGQV